MIEDLQSLQDDAGKDDDMQPVSTPVAPTAGEPRIPVAIPPPAAEPSTQITKSILSFTPKAWWILIRHQLSPTKDG